MDAPQLHKRRLLVTNVHVIEEAEHNYEISFDLDWREAFRDDQHWNAAWVFLKIKPGETKEVESVEAAVEQLTDDSRGTTALPELMGAVRTKLQQTFAQPPHPSKQLPGPPLPGPGPLPGRPPSPQELLSGAKQRLAQQAEAHRDDELDELPAPVRAMRLHFRRVVEGGQEVEVEDDIALVNSGTTDGKQTVTTFGHWQHLKVSTQAADHGPAEGTVIVPSEDGVGVFIHRAADGRGPLALRGVRLRTLRPCDGQALKAWVGALEMVHVDAGEFHVGDPQGADGPAGCFYRAGASEEDRSYVIRGENGIVVGDEPGMLTWSTRRQSDAPLEIPAAFPKGSAAYYVLKHQVSQGEYCDFINHLHGSQLTIRFPYGGQGDYRYTIFKTWQSARVCTRPERASNWVSWADAKAFLWWAGLRPLTEFEYEKAARGPIAPVPNEYAWGSSTLVQSLVILGHEAERPIVQGNCNIGNTMQAFWGGDGGQGPVPDDAFRASRYQCHAEVVHMSALDTEQTFTSREETGASYYEIMGLSGNLWEYVITVGVDEGLCFVGEHGTGDLDATGSPNHANSWPAADHRGIGFRGGSWYTKVSSGQVADRCFGSGLLGYQDRSHDTGIRGARTAPKAG